MKILCNTTHSDDFDIDTVYTKDFDIRGIKLIRCNSEEKEIHVPDGVTEISYPGFAYKKTVETVYLPDSVRIINNDAFINSSISKIYLPPNLEVLGDGVFEGSNIEEIEIPPKVKAIQDTTFCRCNKLRRIVIPSSVELIGFLAFYKCENLEYVRISSGVNRVLGGAFEGCKNLKRVEILGNSLKIVGEDAFANCTSLTTISFPDSLETIRWGAFKGCSSLVEVSIPDNVTFYQKPGMDPIFKGCNKLELPPELEYLRIGIPKPQPVEPERRNVRYGQMKRGRRNNSSELNTGTKRSKFSLKAPHYSFNNFDAWYDSDQAQLYNKEFLKTLKSFLSKHPDYKITKFSSKVNVSNSSDVQLINIQLASGEHYEFKFDWTELQETLYDNGPYVTADIYFDEIDTRILDDIYPE